jgi:nanoRNase/pAp phosphatase (c-di-AMP/oligoRNAs hydrolase)
MKTRISRLYRKNIIISNIINAMTENKRFLLVGHKRPDEDCIASTVAMALLLSKFYKDVSIFQSDDFQEQLKYLHNICRFNRIDVISEEEELPDTVDVIISCDTPKPDMMDSCGKIDGLLKDKNIVKVELDHHLGADSEYIGDEGYRLVDQASSTCELIGILAYKINRRKALLEQFQITDILTRNIVVSILTGIVGDSKMGVYLKTRREKRYFRLISNLYNNILASTTTNAKYISSMKEIFEEIEKLSAVEERCFNYVHAKRKFTDSIGYVVLNGEDIDCLNDLCDFKALAFVSKKITDDLADESKKLGLTVYQNSFENPEYYQFKLRRSRSFKQVDLRDVLKKFEITNGGGHEGAIGFRFPVEQIDNLDHFVSLLLTKIEGHLKSISD